MKIHCHSKDISKDKLGVFIIRNYVDENLRVSDGIKNVMNILMLERMPSGNEIISTLNDYTLYNYIARHGGYRKFADELCLEIKDSETKLGQRYEHIVTALLEDNDFIIEEMTTKHPFDLLINNSVKVDVKVARPSLTSDGSRAHAFGINKKYGSCDIYIAVALDEQDNMEKFLIIPSHHLKVVTLCVGKNSKYDIYNNQFKYIKKYSDFYKSI